MARTSVLPTAIRTQACLLGGLLVGVCAAFGCTLDDLGRGPLWQIPAGGAAGSGATGATGGSGATTTDGTGGGAGADAPVCGNGALEAGEACDDGNTLPGDGCDPSCAIEPAFDCETVVVLSPGATTLKGSSAGEPDHGFSNACGYGLGAGDVLYVLEPSLAGRLTLTLHADFDKVLYLRESCDGDAELDCLAGLGDDVVLPFDVQASTHYFAVVDGVDGAEGDFTLEALLEGCGDGVVNLEEQCDDANEDEADGCSTSCQVKCPDGWTKNPANLHCYRIFGDDKTWADAKGACAAIGEGVHLATLATPDEVSFAGAAFDQDNVWIGAGDHVEDGTFAWVTGEPFTYEGDEWPWDDGEPNDGGWFSTEECVEIYANGAFNDEVCDTKEHFLCELEPTGL